MNCIQLLHQSGLKATPHRVALIEVLCKIHAPDIAQINEALLNVNVNMDQVTIYRNLEKLVDKGLVNQLNFNEGKARYELAGHHHHHLICDNCGSIQVYDQADVSHLEQSIKKDFHFTVTSHTLEFFGTCDRCHT